MGIENITKLKSQAESQFHGAYSDQKLKIPCVSTAKRSEYGSWPCKGTSVGGSLHGYIMTAESPQIASINLDFYIYSYRLLSACSVTVPEAQANVGT